MKNCFLVVLQLIAAGILCTLLKPYNADQDCIGTIPTTAISIPYGHYRTVFRSAFITEQRDEHKRI
jgi:hypothetical protein